MITVNNSRSNLYFIALFRNIRSLFIIHIISVIFFVLLTNQNQAKADDEVANIVGLHDKIRQLYDSDNDRIEIDPILLSSPELKDFLLTTLDSETLTLSDAEINFFEDAVVVRGERDLLGINRANISITIRFHDDELATAVKIDVPEGWNFAQSFPSLKNSDLDTAIKRTDQNAPFFIATTHSYHDDDLGIEFERSLNFHGPIEPLATDLWRRDKFSNTETAWFAHGPISRGEGGVTIRLYVANLAENLPFAIAPLTVSLVSEPDSGAASQTTNIELATEIQWGGRTVRAQGLIPPIDTPIMELAADLTGFDLPTSADFARLIGDGSASELIPAEALSDEGLSVTRVGFGIAVHSFHVWFAEIHLKDMSQRRRSLIDESIGIQDLEIELSAHSPFDSQRRSVHCTLLGTLFIGDDIALEAIASSPDYRFRARTRDRLSVKSGDLLQRFVPGLAWIIRREEADIA